MFRTTILSIGLRRFLFLVSFSVLVGCGPSKVETYDVEQGFRAAEEEGGD